MSSRGATMAKLTDNTDSCKGKSFSCCQCYDLKVHRACLLSPPPKCCQDTAACQLQKHSRQKVLLPQRNCPHWDWPMDCFTERAQGEKNALKGLDQLDGKIVLCEWKSSHVMSSVVLNRLQAPATVWCPSFKNSTLVLWCCCIAVQFCFCQLGVLHSVHITLKDSFLRLQWCLTCTVGWEHRVDIKTGKGQLLFTDVAFEGW